MYICAMALFKVLVPLNLLFFLLFTVTAMKAVIQLFTVFLSPHETKGGVLFASCNGHVGRDLS